MIPCDTEPSGRLTYRAFTDTWREGDPAAVGLKPPAGLYEPARGFGKAWGDHPELQQLLGWALEHERPATASFQAFLRPGAAGC